MNCLLLALRRDDADAVVDGLLLIEQESLPNPCAACGWIEGPDFEQAIDPHYSIRVARANDAQGAAPAHAVEEFERYVAAVVSTGPPARGTLSFDAWYRRYLALLAEYPPPP
jgi:hypothetical protein